MQIIPPLTQKRMTISNYFCVFNFKLQKYPPPTIPLCFSTYITILMIMYCILGVLNRLISDCKNAQAPLIPLCFSTYITILIIISLFINPYPDHLVLYAWFMFLKFSLNFNFIYLWPTVSKTLHIINCIIY